MDAQQESTKQWVQETYIWRGMCACLTSMVFTSPWWRKENDTSMFFLRLLTTPPHRWLVEDSRVRISQETYGNSVSFDDSWPKLRSRRDVWTYREGRNLRVVLGHHGWPSLHSGAVVAKPLSCDGRAKAKRREMVINNVLDSKRC